MKISLLYWSLWARKFDLNNLVLTAWRRNYVCPLLHHACHSHDFSHSPLSNKSQAAWLPYKTPVLSECLFWELEFMNIEQSLRDQENLIEKAEDALNWKTNTDHLLSTTATLFFIMGVAHVVVLSQARTLEWVAIPPRSPKTTQTLVFNMIPPDRN